MSTRHFGRDAEIQAMEGKLAAFQVPDFSIAQTRKFTSL